jgi:hypothetical protein
MSIKAFIIFCIALLCFKIGVAQKLKTKNIVIITFDGYRWQELFNGADSSLLFGKKYNTQDSNWRIKKYWGKNNSERRAKITPFFWNTIAKQGQIYGNRNYKNFVNVSNNYWFSYPGYNEIFTGAADSSINSNDHPANHNVNILAFFNQLSDYKGKVASFNSWDTFNKILNEEQSGISINSGFTDVKGDHLTEVQKSLNELQHWLPKDYGAGERHDAVTYSFAKEHVKLNHPRVLQISFVETDGLAHNGKYDYYLDAAHNNDKMIADLWNYMQNDPFYKDQTTFIITEDHGRGNGEQWPHHYYTVANSNEIFFSVIGPDTKPLGEITQQGQWYQNQFAQTIASFLNIKFESGKSLGKPIVEVLPQH